MQRGFGRDLDESLADESREPRGFVGIDAKNDTVLSHPFDQRHLDDFVGSLKELVDDECLDATAALVQDQAVDGTELSAVAAENRVTEPDVSLGHVGTPFCLATSA